MSLGRSASTATSAAYRSRQTFDLLGSSPIRCRPILGEYGSSVRFFSLCA